MTAPTLTIDLTAIAANWRALDALSGSGEAGAVVKADAYGLGVAKIAPVLLRAGARRFFVASPDEGAVVRQSIGPGPQIFVFSGHMAGDTEVIQDLDLTPLLNSLDQMTRHFESLPGHGFGVQIDTGLNRLGMEAGEWLAVAAIALERDPALVISHLACADDPQHPMNAAQLAEFHDLTDGIGVPRSLSATGGILLGSQFHFDVTRPGIGLYGGLSAPQLRPVLRLSAPVVQIREVSAGEAIGYGRAYEAQAPMLVATIPCGYADGLPRSLAPAMRVWHEGTPCPVVGRISMDLITVDITALPEEPRLLDILCPEQGPEALAAAAGTISYEILTSLSRRYTRSYVGSVR